MSSGSEDEVNGIWTLSDVKEQLRDRIHRIPTAARGEGGVIKNANDSNNEEEEEEDRYSLDLSNRGLCKRSFLEKILSLLLSQKKKGQPDGGKRMKISRLILPVRHYYSEQDDILSSEEESDDDYHASTPASHHHHRHHTSYDHFSSEYQYIFNFLSQIETVDDLTLKIYRPEVLVLVTRALQERNRGDSNDTPPLFENLCIIWEEVQSVLLWPRDLGAMQQVLTTTTRVAKRVKIHGFASAYPPVHEQDKNTSTCSLVEAIQFYNCSFHEDARLYFDKSIYAHLKGLTFQACRINSEACFWEGLLRSLSRLPELERLIFLFTRIGDVPLQILKQLVYPDSSSGSSTAVMGTKPFPRLEHLTLESASISLPGMQALSSCGSLTSSLKLLNLARNRLFGDALSLLVNFECLEYLNITAACNDDGDGLQSYLQSDRAASLRHLILSEIPLQSDTLKCLHKLSLKTLELFGCDLTPLDFERLVCGCDASNNALQSTLRELVLAGNKSLAKRKQEGGESSLIKGISSLSKFSKLQSISLEFVGTLSEDVMVALCTLVNCNHSIWHLDFDNPKKDDQTSYSQELKHLLMYNQLGRCLFGNHQPPPPSLLPVLLARGHRIHGPDGVFLLLRGAGDSRRVQF